MKSSILSNVRMEAGLGNPPSEYTNNDTVAANCMIKQKLNFEIKKPYQFIENVKEIIETQFRNEDRAVLGRGPYKLTEKFDHLAIDNERWAKMNHAHREAQFPRFIHTGMDG